MHAGLIAGPGALDAFDPDFGLACQTQFLDDDLGDVRHARDGGCAQIVDVAGIVFGEGDIGVAIGHAVDAFLDQEIVLFLAAVAADQQVRRIGLEALQEVVDHAMGHAIADDVAEAEHPGIEVIDVAERRDEGFAGDLAGAIGRDRQQRPHGLAHRHVLADIAVDRSGGGEDHVANLQLAHGV